MPASTCPPFAEFDVVPVALSWFKFIRRESGEPDLLATIILGEIIRCCRMEPYADDEGGTQIQKEYSHFAQLFNVSKKQVRTSMSLLESLGLIKREIRNVKLENGRIVPNVLFIKLITDKVAAITIAMKQQ